MAADRDLAVAFVRARFGTGARDRTGWEVAAATGVRGLRLLAEGGGFGAFRLTERSADAYRVLEENARRFPGAVAECADGRTAPAGASFDYVDVDPYGSPIPFVAGAIAAVRPGGVLAVTATDLLVLAGPQAAACERRYGARPVRGRLGPEGGLRILMAYLARSAAADGRSFRPLLAYVRDHHVRVYAEIGRALAEPSAGSIATLDPVTFDGPWLGDGGPFGPLWVGPLFDPVLVGALADPPHAARPEEVHALLGRFAEEAAVDRPFYYEANGLAHRLGLAEPPSLAAVRAALTDAGFATARTHARPEGFRTTAPRSTVESIVRALSPPASPRTPESGHRPAPRAGAP